MPGLLLLGVLIYVAPDEPRSKDLLPDKYLFLAFNKI